MKHHLESKHSDAQSHTCDNCDPVFESYRDLRNHSIAIHTPEDFEHGTELLSPIGTDVSSRVVTDHENLEMMEGNTADSTMHASEKQENYKAIIAPEVSVTNKCCVCEELLNSEGALTQHMICCHQVDEYPCPQCDLTFNIFTDVRYHIKSCHEPALYHPSEMCEVFFTSKLTLEKHMGLKHEYFTTPSSISSTDSERHLGSIPQADGNNTLEDDDETVGLTEAEIYERDPDLLYSAYHVVEEVSELANVNIK